MIKLQITNLDKLQAFADKFPATAQKYVDSAIVQAIGELQRQSQPLIPVDTARLKNSFIPAFSPFVGIFGTAVNYATSVHDLYSAGTPYKNPSKNKNAVAGFLEIGAKRANPKIESIFNNALQKLVDSLSW